METKHLDRVVFDSVSPSVCGSLKEAAVWKSAASGGAVGLGRA